MPTLKSKWKADIEETVQEEVNQKMHNQINNFNLNNRKMKRKPRFLIGIASAIITFSILAATVGRPKYFDRHNHEMKCHKNEHQSEKAK